MYPGGLSAMWGFHNAHEKQKAGIWLESCISSCAFQNIQRCLWWRSVLLLFFVTVGSSASVVKQFADTSPNIQSVQKRIESESQLQSYVLDVQHLISQMPFWKLHVLSEVLQGHSISGWTRPQTSTKRYKKLFKRAVKYIDFNDKEFEELLEMAVKEAVKKVLAGRKVPSEKSNILDPYPNDHGESQSDFKVDFLSDFLRRANGSDGFEPKTLLEDTLMPEQDRLKWSLIKSLSTSKPEGTTSDFSSSEPELKPLSKLEWPEIEFQSMSLDSSDKQGSLQAKPKWLLEWSTTKPVLASKPSHEQDSLKSKLEVKSTMEPYLASIPTETNLHPSREKSWLKSMSATQPEWPTVKGLVANKLDDLFLSLSSEQDSLQSKLELHSEWSTKKPLSSNPAETLLQASSEVLQSDPTLQIERLTTEHPFMTTFKGTSSLSLGEEKALQPKPDLQLEFSTTESDFISSSSVQSSIEQVLSSKSVSQSEWSTLKTLSRPESSSLRLSSKQGLFWSQLELQFPQSLTILPISNAQSFGYSDGHAEKSIDAGKSDKRHTTAVSSVHPASRLHKALSESQTSEEFSDLAKNSFANDEEDSVLEMAFHTISDSSAIANTLISSSDSPSSMTQKSSNLTTIDQFGIEQTKDGAFEMAFYTVSETSTLGNTVNFPGNNPSSILQESLDLTTDPFSFEQSKDQAFEMAFQPFESLTLGNALISSSKNPEFDGLEIAPHSPTSLVNDPVIVNANWSQHDDFFISAGQSVTHDYTSNPATISSTSQTKSSWGSFYGTIGTPTSSVIPRKENTGTIFFTLNQESDYEIRPEENMDDSLQMKHSTINAIASNNIATQTTPKFHTSVSAETSKHDGNVEELTTGPLYISTSSSDVLGSAKVSSVLTEAVSIQVSSEKFPSDAPLQIMGRDPARVLKTQNATTVPIQGIEKTTYHSDQTDTSNSLKSSLNTDTFSYKPTELSRTVVVPLFIGTDSSDLEGSPIAYMEKQSPLSTELTHSLAFSLFSGQISLKPTELPSTGTLSLLQYDTFRDGINGIENLNEINSPTSTESSNTLLPWYNKMVTSATPEWKSARAEQYGTISGHSAITHRSEKVSSAPYATHMSQKDRSSYATMDLSTASADEKLLQISPTEMQLMDSTKSAEALTSFLLVNYSSVSPSMTSITEPSMTLQSTTNNQGYTAASIKPGFGIFNIPTVQTQVSPGVTDIKAAASQSVAPTLKPVFLTSHSKSKTTVRYTSTPQETIQTPAPKIWIPLSSDVIMDAFQSTVPPVVTVPLNFHLVGISYSEKLANGATDEYKRLEREVILLLNKVFATRYQQEYLKVEVLGFSQGSVMVKSNIMFDGSLPTPSGSDIVRTVVSDDLIKHNYFGWKIDASTVDCQGYTLKNLESQRLSLSFLVLHAGFIAVSQKYGEKQNYLESLHNKMFQALGKSFPVTNVSFSQIRDVYGDLEVRGTLYLNSSNHTNIQALLSSLLPLSNSSVDLRSISVGGMYNELLVYPISFRLMNKLFEVNLLDLASPEFQKLSKDLSVMVQLALHDNSLLQVVIREFNSGSVVCKGDLIYRLPAPSSGEILREFLQSLRSNGMLGSSDFRVDFKSITIGDSSSRPYNEYIDFPGFGVAIIVMCGLCILLFPVIVYVCYQTRMLGRRKKATIERRHGPNEQSHDFEMDNQAFRASIEQV